jgi:ATP-dependent DNA helicase DinG
MHDRLDALYDALIAALPGSAPRAGQRQMLHAIADALAGARFEPDGELKLAVLEAGTGVGKTRAYLAAGLLLARQQGVKLVISTSTVALQEQVLLKDLPELAQALEDPATVALLKGRGRYVCPVKLDQAITGDQEPLDLDAPEGAELQPLATGASERFARLRQRLRASSWDGERDSLPPEDLLLWPAIGADRASCTSRNCPQFNSCPYFDAKRAASKADVLVTNHDLVLSSLRSDFSALPSGERAIYVFDEGHHLPATALAHFACEASLTERRWLPRLEKALLAAAASLRYPGQGFDGCTGMLTQALDDLVRGLLQELGPEALGEAEDGEAEAPRSQRLRLPGGVWPEGIDPLWLAVEQHAQRLHDRASELSQWMRALRQEDEDLAPLVSIQVADIGPPFKRLSDLLELAQLMQQQGEPPPAKWLDFEAPGGLSGDLLRITAKASPLFAGGVLRQQLWSRLRGAVVTSATLRALGRFDFFLRESGLAGLDGVQTLAVDSPFDYPKQGRFLVAETRSSPKAATAHTAEVAILLADDLQQVEHGALVLCSSWVQLRALVAAMPANLRRQMRVQGEAPREQLLREHRVAVRAGERAVLVGLQSFGEGLDLPGRECEWVFLPKLPFMTPADPVAEARAEWLTAQGRNPFVELVVPATGVRLNQWAGRGIRSESDRATIVCYDPRLMQTAFGRQLLAGLPPFTKLLRRAGQAALTEIR